MKSYADLHRIEAAYASMIAGVDKSLGDLWACCERLGVADDTIFLFMSDNGGLSAHGRGGAKHTHNAPLKSGKGSAYEGGIRVPMIVRWPGVVKPASRASTPVISDDFFPTILAMAGVAIPAAHAPTVDGRDLGPILRGGEAGDERVLGWHYPHQWGAPGPGVFPFTAIRKGSLKLIYDHARTRFELYDLAADLGETKNLADEKPQVRATMAQAMREWLEARNAQMSVVKATGKAVRLP